MKVLINIYRIKKLVSEYYNVTIQDLESKNRSKHIVKARSVYCFLSNEFTNLTLEVIGNEINRCHSLVIFSINKIKVEKEIYSDLKNDLIFFNQKLINPSCVITNVDLLAIAEMNTKSKDYLF